jgi:hypothetical protein
MRGRGTDRDCDVMPLLAPNIRFRSSSSIRNTPKKLRFPGLFSFPASGFRSACSGIGNNVRLASAGSMIVGFFLQHFQQHFEHVLCLAGYAKCTPHARLF